MIDVDGHQIFLESSGEGGPTVVLESGIGSAGSLSGWGQVVDGIKDSARICFYDRAGLGNSEPGPEPRDCDQIVEELHTLLLNAGLHPPFILVGHSMGGLYIQVFAARYPGEVAGMVFVDPSPKEFVEPLTAEELADITKAGLPSGVMAEITTGINASVAEVQAIGSLPDVPVVVLTSSLAFAMADGGIGSERWQLLSDCHQSLADQVGDGIHIIASTAGHCIQVDEPNLVIDAIRSVIDKVKQ